MKRIFLFGILPFILGLVAAWLRAGELAYVFDFSSGLPSNPMWFSPVLSALVIICVILFLIFAFRFKPGEPHGSASPALMPAACASFCVLFTFSGYELYLYMQTREITSLIFGILTLLCSVSQLFLGIKHLEIRDNTVYNIFAAIPVFWACYALILIFRERISDPIISDYIYLLLAFVGILLFVYAQCGYVFGKSRQRIAIVSGALAVFFCTLELFAPLFTSLLSPDSLFMRPTLEETAPLVAFLIYIPFSLEEMLRNANRVGLK